jgi:hypothetical protein
VPLFPMGSRWLYLLALCVLGPLVEGGMLANLPPILAGWLAGKKLPDDANVITLWKMLVGLPLFAVWSATVTLLLLWVQPFLALVYLFFTWMGIALYYRVKKLAVAVSNGFDSPELGPRLLAFRETVLAELPPESPAEPNPSETTAHS